MNAKHGWWCNSVTWPTRCRNCGEKVFFFQCDCGSGVFFDDLGHPWPIHDCGLSWAKNLRRWEDDKGRINVEISKGTILRRELDGSIDVLVVSGAKRRERNSDPIKKVVPDGSQKMNIVGVLRQMQIKVDVERSLKLPNTLIASGFLGPLASGDWGKITVHTQSPNENVLNSYTAWVPSAFLSDDDDWRGLTVRIKMFSKSIPGVDNFWICNYFEFL